MPYVPNYAPGDVLTAAAMNSIGEAWTSFGTGANWKASLTNPTLNNGTWSARYSRNNKVVMVRGKIIVGSTTVIGNGSYRIDLPVSAQTTGWALGDPIGLATYYDASTGKDYSGIVLWWSGTQVALYALNGNEYDPTSTTYPFTPATNDELKFTFTYEAA